MSYSAFNNFCAWIYQVFKITFRHKKYRFLEVIDIIYDSKFCFKVQLLKISFKNVNTWLHPVLISAYWTLLATAKCQNTSVISNVNIFIITLLDVKCFLIVYKLEYTVYSTYACPSKCIGVYRKVVKPNSWKYNFVEVSGHNIESSQTWGFCIQYTLHYITIFTLQTSFKRLCWGGGGGE